MNNELRCQFQLGNGCALTITRVKGYSASTEAYCDKDLCPIWQTYLLTMKIYLQQKGEDDE